MKTLKTTLRWIGTFTVPIIISLLFSAFATHICCTTNGPYAEKGDGLSLLGVSCTSGIIFVMATKKIAPSHKKIALIANAILITLYFLVSFIFYWELAFKSAGETFGILRICVFLISIWVSLYMQFKLNHPLDE